MFGCLLTACCVCSGCNYPTYYPQNCYYASYSAYAPYSCGCVGYYDPYFSFGCAAAPGCIGWAPPAGCCYPAIVVSPAPEKDDKGKDDKGKDDKGKKGKEKSTGEKVDDVLKALDQIKADGKKADERLKAIEDDLQKLKKIASEAPKPGVKPPEDKKPDDKKPDDKKPDDKKPEDKKPDDKKPMAEPKPGDPKPDIKPKDKLEISLDDRAVVQVQLPAGAKLFLDDQATNSEGKAQRTIVTPKLEPGAKYAYTLRAEFVSDGKTITQTREISFQAGQHVNVSFEGMTTTMSEAAFSAKD